ncbi:hypothetical protein ACVGW4_10100, partial [Enterobacter hormaechei]
ASPYPAYTLCGLMPSPWPSSTGSWYKNKKREPKLAFWFFFAIRLYLKRFGSSASWATVRFF